MTRPHKCRLIGIHNCNWCVTGSYKPADRKRTRSAAKRDLRASSAVGRAADF